MLAARYQGIVLSTSKVATIFFRSSRGRPAGFEVGSWLLKGTGFRVANRPGFPWIVHGLVFFYPGVPGYYQIVSEKLESDACIH